MKPLNELEKRHALPFKITNFFWGYFQALCGFKIIFALENFAYAHHRFIRTRKPQN